MRSALRPTDPRRLGEYDLLARLGEGGMGTVYLGRRPGGPLAAIKVIRPEYAAEDEFRARFRSEVNRARQVPPFCTAEVLDADPDHVTPYLVVEYVDGPSLADVVSDQGPLPATNLHGVAVGVATALAAIHGAGVIHRDLKPRNVLFALGTPKVIDFGIARALEPTSQHTRTSQMVGTIAYMAPERFDTDSGRTVGPAADVFAWGAVIAYAGNGRTPFAADSPTATAARILTQPPALGALSGPIRDLVAYALAKEPEDRPSASELLDELLAMDSRGINGRAAAVRESFRPSVAENAIPASAPKRPRYRVWVIAVLGIALLLAGLAAMRPGRKPLARISSSPTANRIAQLASGQAIIDPLDRPGLWHDATGDSGGSCVFESQLVVTTIADFDFACPGPKDRFGGDQSIAVDATVLSANACAVIWFRDVGTRGYELSLCAGETRLERYDDKQGESLIQRTRNDPFPPGRLRHVTVDIVNEGMTLAVDGHEALRARLTDRSLAAGQVVLGATNNTYDGESQAAFANMVIRAGTGPASPGPTYDDVLHGRTTSAAKLLSFDPIALSAVIEPTIVLSGPAYCAKYRVPISQSRCQQAWTTEDSHIKITLGVDRDAVVTTACDRTAGAVCPLPLPQVAGWLKKHPNALVSITSTDGTVTRMTDP